MEKKHLKMKCNIGIKRGTRSKMMCKIRAHFPPIWVYSQVLLVICYVFFVSREIPTVAFLSKITRSEQRCLPVEPYKGSCNHDNECVPRLRRSETIQAKKGKKSALSQKFKGTC